MKLKINFESLLQSPDGNYKIDVRYSDEIGTLSTLRSAVTSTIYTGLRPVSFSPDSKLLFACQYDKEQGRAIPVLIDIKSLKVASIKFDDLSNFPPIKSGENCPSSPGEIVRWNGDKIRYSMPETLGVKPSVRLYEVDIKLRSLYRVLN